jgi:hypothetical protein
MRLYIYLAASVICAMGCTKPCAERTANLARFKADGVQYCTRSMSIFQASVTGKIAQVLFTCTSIPETNKANKQKITIRIQMVEKAGQYVLDNNGSAADQIPFVLTRQLDSNQHKFVLDTLESYSCIITKLDTLKRNIAIEFAGTLVNGTNKIIITDGYFDRANY